MLPGNFYGKEIRHGNFGGLNFGPGIFWGFDFCPHSMSLKIRITLFSATKERPYERLLHNCSEEVTATA